MGVLVNPLVILTQKDVTFWKVVAVEPTFGDFDGQTIINSDDNKAKVWFNGCWNTWFEFTPGTPPANVDLTNEDGTTLTNEDGETLQREP